MAIFTVVILVFGVTALFGLLFGGWLRADAPKGIDRMPWKIFAVGLPNMWSRGLLFVTYWGLLIGRIFWQPGGVPSDNARPSFLNLTQCSK